jgi:hypothetical protein
MNPVFHPTRELVLHPAVKHIPMLPADSADAQAITNSLRIQGFLAPLKLHKGRVCDLDDRERLRAAVELGIEQVPCVEVCEGDLHTIILHGLVARTHYTKSAIAYLAFPHLEKALAESKARQYENLRRGTKRRPGETPLTEAKTAEELAEQLGISRRLFFSARNVHGHFAKSPELREKFERLILHGEPNADDIDTRRPYSLARVIQGIAGWESAQNGKPSRRDELLRWNEKVKAFGDPRKWKGWEEAAPETREYVERELSKAIPRWPREVRAVLLGALLDMESELTAPAAPAPAAKKKGAAR